MAYCAFLETSSSDPFPNLSQDGAQRYRMGRYGLVHSWGQRCWSQHLVTGADLCNLSLHSVSLDASPSGSTIIAAQVAGRARLVTMRGSEGTVQKSYTYDATNSRSNNPLNACYLNQGDRILFGSSESCLLLWNTQKEEVVCGLEHDDSEHLSISCKSFNDSLMVIPYRWNHWGSGGKSSSSVNPGYYWAISTALGFWGPRESGGLYHYRIEKRMLGLVAESTPEECIRSLRCLTVLKGKVWYPFDSETIPLQWVKSYELNFFPPSIAKSHSHLVKLPMYPWAVIYLTEKNIFLWWSASPPRLVGQFVSGNVNVGLAVFGLPAPTTLQAIRSVATEPSRLSAKVQQAPTFRPPRLLCLIPVSISATLKRSKSSIEPVLIKCFGSSLNRFLSQACNTIRSPLGRFNYRLPWLLSFKSSSISQFLTLWVRVSSSSTLCIAHSHEALLPRQTRRSAALPRAISRFSVFGCAVDWRLIYLFYSKPTFHPEFLSN
jgi:hypothetical protein